ncbi:DUF6789 family protein [Halocatena pleomorpha]|uniref:Uncharacterized protein n=1 Tax=Halocatena pleomorpha TaxID=1785090 RepID=A0A3P3R949_9EURY|nr:DUF6789 family protein [Halocatena pleomorpha]RRJ29568.1 hypothetical protein EIK79_13110 [Halocatena pleomorpha]
MEPVRSSIGGGIAATVVLTAFLFITDFLLTTNPFVFATFTSLCAIGGPPFCEVGSQLAAAITFFWYIVLFAIAWPLFFGGFTWGLPGETGLTHGAVFSFILWVGYVSALYGFGLGGQNGSGGSLLLLITLVAYLLYGLVLGGVYDLLSRHRTFLGSKSS